MSYILFERKGHVGILTISRPEALNALNSEVLRELEEQLTAVEECVDLRTLIITGEGRSFVAGADIAEMKNMSVDEAYAFAKMGDRVFTHIENLPIPVIAAVNGFALGGGMELALSCDIRLASEKAKFGQPEVGLGITPGFGGTQRLSRTVGMARAMELILTGNTIDAQTALSLGIVNHVYKTEDLMNEAVSMGEKIAENAPVAVKESKKAIQQFWCGNMSTDLEYEAGAFSRCFATADQKMGMQAFLDKKPHDKYSGR